jgi:hypothetical protein
MLHRYKYSCLYYTIFALIINLLVIDLKMCNIWVYKCGILLFTLPIMTKLIAVLFGVALLTGCSMSPKSADMPTGATADTVAAAAQAAAEAQAAADAAAAQAAADAAAALSGSTMTGETGAAQ